MRKEIPEPCDLPAGDGGFEKLLEKNEVFADRGVEREHALDVEDAVSLQGLIREPQLGLKFLTRSDDRAERIEKTFPILRAGGGNTASDVVLEARSDIWISAPRACPGRVRSRMKKEA